MTSQTPTAMKADWSIFLANKIKQFQKKNKLDEIHLAYFLFGRCGTK
ncbi:hypothetical protein L1283_000686 [Sphingobacterium sp. HSC-15S19]